MDTVSRTEGESLYFLIFFTTPPALFSSKAGVFNPGLRGPLSAFCWSPYQTLSSYKRPHDVIRHVYVGLPHQFPNTSWLFCFLEWETDSEVSRFSGGGLAMWWAVFVQTCGQVRRWQEADSLQDLPLLFAPLMHHRADSLLCGFLKDWEMMSLTPSDYQHLSVFHAKSFSFYLLLALLSTTQPQNKPEVFFFCLSDAFKCSANHLLPWGKSVFTFTEPPTSTQCLSSAF